MKDLARYTVLGVILTASVALMFFASEDKANGIISIETAIILTLLVYFSARELIGRWWALFPTFLFGFSPIVIAKADEAVHMTFALALSLAVFSFLSFLYNFSKKQLFLTGFSLGTAFLISWDAIVVIPYLFLLILIFFLINKKNLFKSFIGIIAISLVFTFSFGAILYRPIDSYLAASLVQIKNLIDSRESNFPIVFLMREPLPSLVLIIFALAISLMKFLKSALRVIFKRSKIWLDYLNTHFVEFAVFLFIVFWLRKLYLGPGTASAKDFLPVLPMIYILTTGVLKKWFSLDEVRKVRNMTLRFITSTTEVFAISLKSLILTAVVIWYFIIIIGTFPDFENYFNGLQPIFSVWL